MFLTALLPQTTGRFSFAGNFLAAADNTIARGNAHATSLRQRRKCLSGSHTLTEGVIKPATMRLCAYTISIPMAVIRYRDVSILS